MGFIGSLGRIGFIGFMGLQGNARLRREDLIRDEG